MEEKECENLIKAMNELDKHIEAYEKRVNSENYHARDEERVELFLIIKDRFERALPNCTLFKDGMHLCANCKSNVGAIYAAADDVGVPVRFCPYCGQAFNIRINIE